MICLTTMMMDKSSIEGNKTRWKQYQYEHKDSLLKFARKMDICDANAEEDIILAESFSRALAARAIFNNYRNITVYAMPLYHHFDFLVVDEDGNKRGVEAKYRNNESDKYDTDFLSKQKKNYNKVISEDIPIDVYYTFSDGKVRVYDLNGKSDEGRCSHNKTTAIEGPRITEDGLYFNPMDALWTTTVSIPL